MDSREIRLASRPAGVPTPDSFSFATVDMPPPADGQVLVRNLFMSVDPYMRGRMNDVKSYVPSFRIGEPLEGGAVGGVIESRAPGIAVGAIVTSSQGWRDASSPSRANCVSSTARCHRCRCISARWARPASPCGSVSIWSASKPALRLDQAYA